MKLNQEKILIGCGVWLLVLPFTGFPGTWKMVLTGITGLVVVYLSALVYKKMLKIKRSMEKEVKTETFTETMIQQ